MEFTKWKIFLICIFYMFVQNALYIITVVYRWFFDILLMCYSILSEGMHNMKYKMNVVLENKEFGMVFYLVLCTLGCLITANSETTFFLYTRGTTNLKYRHYLITFTIIQFWNFLLDIKTENLYLETATIADWNSQNFRKEIVMMKTIGYYM